MTLTEATAVLQATGDEVTLVVRASPPLSLSRRSSGRSQRSSVVVDGSSSSSSAKAGVDVPPSPAAHPATAAAADSTTLTVTITRLDGESLGIGIAGRVGRSGGLCVKKIMPGGAVARLGGLCEGDGLVDINGVNVEGYTHAEAVALLKGLGGAIVFRVRRAAAAAAAARGPLRAQLE